jgi:MFS family permease
MFRTLNQPAVWATTLAAAGILMVTMGARQSLGLFVSPLNTSTGLGVASISLALAVAQFTWGAVQPLAGAAADRYGPGRVLFAGLLLLALGSALTPFMSSTWGLIVSLGLLSAIGSGAGSFSVLIGASSQRLPLEARAAASGVINAGGSFGQFVFAPMLQALIQLLGWMGALWSLALMTLAALPLVRVLAKPGEHAPKAVASEAGLWQSVQQAMADRSYQFLNLGFFTCGFHIAFLVTHLPGEVDLCGLPSQVASWALAIIGLFNIAGSLYAGSCIARYRSKVCPVLDVWFARPDGRALSAGAEDRTDLLRLCRWTGLHLAGDRAANRRHRRQAVWRALSGHPVRHVAALAPDRRLPRRLSRRHRADAPRRLHLDVVRGHRAGAGRRTVESADQGSGVAEAGTGVGETRTCLGGQGFTRHP